MSHRLTKLLTALCLCGLGCAAAPRAPQQPVCGPPTHAASAQPSQAVNDAIWMQEGFDGGGETVVLVRQVGVRSR